MANPGFLIRCNAQKNLSYYMKIFIPHNKWFTLEKWSHNFRFVFWAILMFVMERIEKPSIAYFNKYFADGEKL